MIVSDRAKNYLSSNRVSCNVACSYEQVYEFFERKNLPKENVFIDCLVVCGGLRLTTKREDVSFYSLNDLMECDDEDLHYAFLENEHGKWYHAFECSYPGLAYIHESGAIYFESDMTCKAFDSLGSMIEMLALVSEYETQFNDIHILSGYINVDLSGELNSVPKLVNYIGMELDSNISDSNFLWGRINNSLVELLHLVNFEEKAECALFALCSSKAEAFRLKSALQPLLTYHTIDGEEEKNSGLF